MFLRIVCLELRDDSNIIPSDAQRNLVMDVDELDSDSEDTERGGADINNDEIAAVQVEVLKQVCQVKPLKS